MLARFCQAYLQGSNVVGNMGKIDVGRVMLGAGCGL
jgi:hypothetical protein